MARQREGPASASSASEAKKSALVDAASEAEIRALTARAQPAAFAIVDTRSRVSGFIRQHTEHGYDAETGRGKQLGRYNSASAAARAIFHAVGRERDTDV